MAEYNNSNNALVSPESFGAGLPWKIFIFSLILLGAVVGSYLGLVLGYRPFLNNRIAAVQQSIDDLAASVSVEEQEDLLRFYSQIVNLKTLLDKHISLAKFFPFLEQQTNRRVSYDVAFLNTQNRELILEGVAESYPVLAEQLQALHQAPEVASYTLSQSQTAEGRVRFRIVAVLTENLFK
jgi:hypothetical protein